MSAVVGLVVFVGMGAVANHLARTRTQVVAYHQPAVPFPFVPTSH